MRDQLRVKERDGPVRGPSLYDQHFAKWVESQVELLRTGRATALDVPNLIEELEGLTKRDLRALGAQLKRIMAHMLKQRFQPQRAAGAGSTRSRMAARRSPTTWSRARGCVERGLA